MKSLRKEQVLKGEMFFFTHNYVVSSLIPMSLDDNFKKVNNNNFPH